MNILKKNLNAKGKTHLKHDIFPSYIVCFFVFTIFTSSIISLRVECIDFGVEDGYLDT